MTGVNGNGTSTGNGKFDAGQVVEDLLTKLNVDVTGTQSATSNGSTTTSSTTTPTAAVLKQAQVDLKHLQQIQSELDQKIQAKKNQVKDLMIRVSPLVCITQNDQALHQLLGHLVSFLDEEALWKLERALPSVMEAPAIMAQWNYLDMRNHFRSNSIDCTARERGIRFVLASNYAKQMERSGKYHYNPRQYITKEYPWPNKLYAREDFQNDFYAYDNGDEPPPALEFFVRVTYRLTEDDDKDAPTKCLLEGFLSDYSDLDPWDREKYTIIELGDNDNTHVHMVCNDITMLDEPENMGLNIKYNWRNKLSMEWPREDQQHYMKRISVTVLACEPTTTPGVDTTNGTATANGDNGNTTSTTTTNTSNGCPLKSHLVVATRGFKQSAQPSQSPLLAIMPPRSYLAKARTANLLDCVNVGFKPSEENNGKVGFRILVDWGTQEVYTRRKSIFDAYA